MTHAEKMLEAIEPIYRAWLKEQGLAYRSAWSMMFEGEDTLTDPQFAWLENMACIESMLKEMQREELGDHRDIAKG